MPDGPGLGIDLTDELAAARAAVAGPLPSPNAVCLAQHNHVRQDRTIQTTTPSPCAKGLLSTGIVNIEATRTIHSMRCNDQLAAWAVGERSRPDCAYGCRFAKILAVR